MNADDSIRQQVVRGIRANGPADSEGLDALVARISAGNARRVRGFRIAHGAVMFLVIFAAGMALSALGYQSRGLIGALEMAPIGGSASSIAYWVALRLGRRLIPHHSLQAAAELAEQPAVRGLSALYDAVAWGDRKLEHVILAGLRQVLPAIPALDERTLTRPQRAILYSRLGQLDRESACVVLRLTPATGDRFAIRHVRRLAVRSPDAVVRDAAEECLAALRERFEGRKPEDVLLRPVESGNPVESALLRPAQGVPERDSTQLLRPAGRGTD